VKGSSQLNLAEYLKQPRSQDIPTSKVLIDIEFAFAFAPPCGCLGVAVVKVEPQCGIYCKLGGTASTEVWRWRATRRDFFIPVPPPASMRARNENISKRPTTRIKFLAVAVAVAVPVAHAHAHAAHPISALSYCIDENPHSASEL